MGKLAEFLRKRAAKKAGVRVSRLKQSSNRMTGIETTNVEIPDINEGGWTLINQPPGLK